METKKAYKISIEFSGKILTFICFNYSKTSFTIYFYDKYNNFKEFNLSNLISIEQINYRGVKNE